MSIFTDLKDGLVRRIASSFLLRAFDGRKTELSRGVQAVNHLIVSLFLFGSLADELLGWKVLPALDSVNAQWIVILQYLGGLGLQLGLADADAKKRLAEKK